MASPGLAADGPTTTGAVIRPATLGSYLLKADDYFLGRQNPSNVIVGITLLRQQVAAHPQDYESWWRIARFDNYLARRAQDKEKVRLLRDSIEAGKRAAALQPNRVEGHFWLGASYGLLAEESNLLEGFRLIDPTRKEMETVVKLDPSYELGSGLQILGRLYFRAPFFKGGDKQKSIEVLEDCLKRYPDNFLTMLYLAESYEAVGRREEARRLLEKIIAMCPDPDYGPELADNQAEARQMLAKLGR